MKKSLTNIRVFILLILLTVATSTLAGLSIFVLHGLKIIPDTNISFKWLLMPIIMFIVYGIGISAIASPKIKKSERLKSQIDIYPPIIRGQEFVENAPLIFYRDSFSAIVAVLEARDPYTGHHSERVAQMAASFCEKLHLSPLQIELIEMSAIVHDIGKVGIMDSTLQNTGKLNEAEWKEMKTHPEIGANILLKAGRQNRMNNENQLKNVADSVIAHHERWDGSGYPRGLKEDEIPYAARIIAICDSVDAMLSHRVYRNKMTQEQCKAELEKGKGIMYQPAIVESFLENWDKIVTPLYGEKEDEIDEAVNLQKKESD